MISLNNPGTRDTDFCFHGCGATSTDPRLISPVHNGESLTLDEPPFNGKVLPDVTRYIPGYSTGIYPSYQSINSGQVHYYIDPELAVPFIPQLYSTDSIGIMEPYVDPMGSYKPHYTRRALLGTRRALPYGSTQFPDCSRQYCAQWVKDETNHREDLLSKQQWYRNQTEWLTKISVT